MNEYGLNRDQLAMAAVLMSRQAVLPFFSREAVTHVFS
jgi:hypothetical protein